MWGKVTEMINLTCTYLLWGYFLIRESLRIITDTFVYLCVQTLLRAALRRMYPCVTLICQVIPARCTSTLLRVCDYVIVLLNVAFGLFRESFSLFRRFQHFTVISCLLAFRAAINLLLFYIKILYLLITIEIFIKFWAILIKISSICNIFEIYKIKPVRRLLKDHFLFRDFLITFLLHIYIFWLISD